MPCLARLLLYPCSPSLFHLFPTILIHHSLLVALDRYSPLLVDSNYLVPMRGLPLLPTLISSLVCLFFFLWGGVFGDDGHSSSTPEPLGAPKLSSVPNPSFRQQIVQAAQEVGDSASVWSSVYVINLATRPDRKMHMEKIAHALELNFTYVEAVRSDGPAVSWIMERLREEQVKQIDPDHQKDPRLWQGKPWRKYVFDNILRENTKYELDKTYDDVYLNWALWPAHPAIACYMSHLKTWALAKENNDESVLILEDDVDMEFSLVDKWKEMTHALGDAEHGWDLVYLGYIMSPERKHQPIYHPGLRKSDFPFGTHAYSLSRRGVNRLLNQTANLNRLFNRPIDHDLPFHLLWSEDSTGQFQPFSAVPPLIIPAQNLGTDIGGGVSAAWGGLLADSTIERLREYESRTNLKKNFDYISSQESVQKM